MYWYQSFQISLDSRSCTLETFTRPNKFSPASGCMVNSRFFHCDHKNDQNKKTDRTTDRRADVHIWIFCRMYLCFNGHIRSVQRYWERLMYQYTPLTLRGPVVLENTDVYIFMCVPNDYHSHLLKYGKTHRFSFLSFHSLQWTHQSLFLNKHKYLYLLSY